MVEWLFDNTVTDLSGNAVGCFYDGVIYGRSGNVFAFMENSSGTVNSKPSIKGIPSYSGIPSNPGTPNFKGSISTGRSGTWSSKSISEVFGVSL